MLSLESRLRFPLFRRVHFNQVTFGVMNPGPQTLTPNLKRDAPAPFREQSEGMDCSNYKGSGWSVQVFWFSVQGFRVLGSP